MYMNSMTNSMVNNNINNQFISPYKLADIIVPGVYEVTFNNNVYDLNWVSHKYDVPKKIYGKLNFYIDYYWRGFLRKNFNVELLLTGLAGTGKTELAKILCNKAIDKGMRVITLANIKYDNNLIKYLDTLDSCIFFFDEFGKVFTLTMQEKMLTMFSNMLGKNRALILTENSKHYVSPFIRNRPGRVLYAKDFKKLDIETVVEYCNEFNLSKEFKKNLMDLYRSVTNFTFDHLIAIVNEHLAEPDIEFKELIGLLNLENFTKGKVLIFKSIKLIDSKEDLILDNFKITPMNKPITFLENYGELYISFKKDDKFISFKLTIDNLYSFVGDVVVFRVNEYELTFDLREPDSYKTTITEVGSNEPQRGFDKFF